VIMAIVCVCTAIFVGSVAALCLYAFTVTQNPLMLLLAGIDGALAVVNLMMAKMNWDFRT